MLATVAAAMISAARNALIEEHHRRIDAGEPVTAIAAEAPERTERADAWPPPPTDRRYGSARNAQIDEHYRRIDAGEPVTAIAAEAPERPEHAVVSVEHGLGDHARKTP